jgi:hypothetical protein
MSGMYGTVKPADINIDEDVEIFYHYRPSLNSDDTDFNFFKTLNTSVLSECKTGDNGDITISGLFNLKLPLDKFNKKGVYTIYIRPKEHDVTIADVGTLLAFSDVRGVVFNVGGTMPSKSNSSNSLVGYRIEYLDDNGKKTGDFTIITSNNLSDVVSNVVTNASEKSVRYRYSTTGRQIFCTVTPSLSTTYKPNTVPYIGESGKRVKLVNTKFNPVMIELDMVEHDAETLSYMMEGNQLIDKDNALITTYNDKGEIYHQSEYGYYKDEYGNPLYEFKKKKDNIDFNQSLTNLE